MDGGDRPFGSLAGAGDRVLWIVSSGGHLVQAMLIDQMIGTAGSSAWITNDVPQTRSMLAGRNAEFLPYVASRDLRGAVRASSAAAAIAKSMRPDRVLSTGAAIAGLALPRLAIAGYPTAFVESIARKSAHSLTGRIAAAAPRVRTFTQYPGNATRRWKYDGSVLASWVAERSVPDVEDRPLRIVVTLGTIRPYRFDRAVDALLRVLRPDDVVTWQLGETTRDDLPGEAFGAMSAAALREHMQAADVVVTHAGAGTIIETLDLGKSPVLAVRRAANGEHVDDHQLDICSEIVERQLGQAIDLASPSRQILLRAAGTRIARADQRD